MTERLRVTSRSAEETPKAAALAPETVERLGAAPGDPLTVEGSRRTTALVVEDGEVPAGAVGLSRAMRRNAGTDVDGSVAVSRVSLDPAERVSLAPTESVAVRGAKALGRSLVGVPVDRGDRVQVSLFGGSLSLTFVATAVEPEGPALVAAGTTLSVSEEPWDDSRGLSEVPPSVTYDDVAGLDEQVRRLRELVERPLEQPDVFERLGRTPLSGVLVHGPAGCGKTLLVHALATVTDATYVDLGSALVGEGARVDDVLRDARDRARESPPALVVVDDLDDVAPADADDARTRRTVAGLRRFVDAVRSDPEIAVVGTARAPDDVHEDLRRGGRFDREVELTIPDATDRLDLLDLHTRGVRLAADVDLEALARRTHGFVGADVEHLVGEAVSAAVRRLYEGVPFGVTPDVSGAQVTMADFEAALSAVDPGAMRDLAVELPSVTYDDIGGLEAVKRELVRAVEWPIRYPDLFEFMGTEAPRGVLLYGPPGTGKTLLARAVANATDANFVSVNGPELLNKYVGESERAIRRVFQRARQHAPTVVFFDEIDAVSPVRGGGDDAGSQAPERVVSQLLTEIDGLEQLGDVTVVGATNRPDRIDPALLRPGRLERLIEVPVPDADARESIFEVHTRGVPMEEIDLAALADLTDGYTGSDIEAVVREACLLAIEEYLQGPRSSADDLRLAEDHLSRALDHVRPSLTPDQREYYDSVGERLGR